MLSNTIAPFSSFQSTHLLRGATSDQLQQELQKAFQSTHLLRGATIKQTSLNKLTPISIHAPLARCDDSQATALFCFMLFQSTHLLRGATAGEIPSGCNGIFQSTHLLRGATMACGSGSLFSGYFNPRTSCEVRPVCLPPTLRCTYFNPRTSCEVRQSP